MAVRTLAIALFALLLLGCVQDAATTTGEDPDQAIAQMEARIVFASDRNGNYDIYTMKPDGSDVVRLTDTEADELEPAWSPDGSLIAFVREVDLDLGPYLEPCEMYVMDSVDADGDGNGDNLRRLTTFTAIEASVREPAWSPDGSKIAFAGWMGTWSIHTVDVQSLSTTRLTFEIFDNRTPNWRPDGTGIAYERDTELFAIEADGTPAGVLVPQASYAAQPAWSGMGSRLAYSDFRVIWVNDYRAGTLEIVTQPGEGEYDTSPAWSPGGELIAFVREDARGGPGNSQRKIVVIHADGVVSATQPAGQIGNNIHPDWFPQHTPIYVRNWSQYDVNEVWLVRGGGPGVPLVREVLTQDLSPLVPGGTSYNDEFRVSVALRHDPSIDPTPSPYHVLEYVQEKLFFDGQPIYHADPLTSVAFAPGVVHVAGYGLVRETIFFFGWGDDPTSRHEQLLRGSDGELYAYRPGATFAGHPEVGSGPILLQTLIDEGYGAYDASQRGP